MSCSRPFIFSWDDTRLYVGAYIQETNLWATFTQPDSQIWRENGFEMLMDVDGTMFNYKQMQINVLGTMLDQVLFLSPHDAATRNLPRDGVKYDIHEGLGVGEGLKIARLLNRLHVR